MSEPQNAQDTLVDYYEENKIKTCHRFEHLFMSCFIFIASCIIALAIGEPAWAVSTETNQFYITSQVTVYVGMWEQCLYGGSYGGFKKCRLYDISQSAIPFYFNCTRWTVCVGLAFMMLVAFPCSILSNPAFQEYFSVGYTLIFRLTTSFCLFITGASGIAVSIWFIIITYGNNLGPIIGPGANTDENVYIDDGNVSYYTPDWACVMEVVVCLMLVISSFIHFGRAIYFYKFASKPVSLAEMEAINLAMRLREREDSNGILKPWYEWNVWEEGYNGEEVRVSGAEAPIYV